MRFQVCVSPLRTNEVNSSVECLTVNEDNYLNINLV